MRQLRVLKLKTLHFNIPLAIRTLESIRSPQLGKILLIVDGSSRPYDVCHIFRPWRVAWGNCDRFLAHLADAPSHVSHRITLLVAMLVENSSVSNVERIFAYFSNLRAGGHYIGLRLCSRSNPEIVQGEFWSNDHIPPDVTPEREGWESLIV